MSRLKFANRSKETNFITNAIAQWGCRPTGLGISAPSGWGKSRLTSQALLNFDSENIIRVNTVRSVK